MLTTETQNGSIREIKIPTYHGPRTGIQKSIIFRYVCDICKFTQDFESSQQTWTCKCESVN